MTKKKALVTNQRFLLCFQMSLCFPADPGSLSSRVTDFPCECCDLTPTLFNHICISLRDYTGQKKGMHQRVVIFNDFLVGTARIFVSEENYDYCRKKDVDV